MVRLRAIPRVRPQAEKVRRLFDAVDRSIDSGEWTDPHFDRLLRDLEGAIAEAYGPASGPLPTTPVTTELAIDERHD